MNVKSTKKAASGALRVCLCGSGGGHARQLLDLHAVWEREDYFFVTERLALGESIAEDHPTFFVTHFAVGQAKLGQPIKMLFAALKNFIESAKIVWKQKPDVVITTGAGSMFFLVLLARLSRAHIVVIDSFARFRGPSTFAKLAGPFAKVRIAQSALSASRWSGAEVYDPLREIAEPRPKKDPLVFATVGATLPFDRLVRLVEEAKLNGLLPEDLILQVGVGGYKPPDIGDKSETIPFSDVTAILERADIVICHGGTGSIITALRQGCRVIVVPRLFSLGEHYDDHQLEIATAFEERGYVKVVRSGDDLVNALQSARTSEPVRLTTDPQALSARLSSLIKQWTEV